MISGIPFISKSQWGGSLRIRRSCERRDYPTNQSLDWRNKEIPIDCIKEIFLWDAWWVMINLQIECTIHHRHHEGHQCVAASCQILLWRSHAQPGVVHGFAFSAHFHCSSQQPPENPHLAMGLCPEKVKAFVLLMKQ